METQHHFPVSLIDYDFVFAAAAKATVLLFLLDWRLLFKKFYYSISLFAKLNNSEGLSATDRRHACADLIVLHSSSSSSRGNLLLYRKIVLFSRQKAVPKKSSAHQNWCWPACETQNTRGQRTFLIYTNNNVHHPSIRRLYFRVFELNLFTDFQQQKEIHSASVKQYICTYNKSKQVEANELFEGFFNKYEKIMQFFFYYKIIAVYLRNVLS